jgi:Family of unknown function (DUF6632)
MQFAKEKNMAQTDHTKYLRIALLLVGLIFTVGIYPLTIIWPSGWSWHTGQSDYLQMILGVYATLGVFLLLASRNPLAHLSLIWLNGVVQHCARRNHGRPGFDQLRAQRSPLGRRPGALCCSGRFGVSDTTRRGGKGRLTGC